MNSQSESATTTAKAVPPAHLTAYWTEDSRDEIQQMARWAKAHPHATPAELAEARDAIRTALAQKAAAKAELSAGRLARMQAAMICPSCKTPAMQVSKVSVGDEVSSGRAVMPSASVADRQAALAMRKTERRDDADRPLPAIWRPDGAGQVVNSPLYNQGRPIYACARCRPVVEAAIVRLLREDSVDETTRGALADDYARALIEAHRPPAGQRLAARVR